jgi:hypothetical protein
MKDGDDNCLILTPSQRPVMVANAAKIEAVSKRQQQMYSIIRVGR